MVKRFISKIVTAMLALIMVINTVAIAAGISTSFTSSWTDANDTNWTITNDTDGDVEAGIKQGISALVLTGADTIEDYTDAIGAVYDCSEGNGIPLVVEYDFEVSNGSYFRVLANNSQNGFAVREDGHMNFIDYDGAAVEWEAAPTNDITVTPNVVHTMRMEMIDDYRATTFGATKGIKYYLDGQLVYSTNNCVVSEKYNLRVRANSVVKLYEIRRYGACNWAEGFAQVERFTGKTAASINSDTTDRLSGVGTSSTDVEAEVVAQSTAKYLAMERVNGKFNWTANTGKNASLVYTTPSTSNSTNYDINVKFAYRGMGPTEMRFTDAGGNMWFSQMKIDEGKLYIASSPGSFGTAVTGWIAPYTDHTLTLSVKENSGGATVYSVSLDGTVVASDISTITSGFALNYPGSLNFYSMAQTYNTGSATTNMDLHNGIFIEEITFGPTAIDEPAQTINITEDFSSGSAGDDWTISGTSGVTTGVTAGQSALVISTGSSAPSSVTAAEFAVNNGSNIETVFEVDFSIKEGTQFGIMAQENKIGTSNEKRHFHTDMTEDGKLTVEETIYGDVTNTGITVTPDVVHTLKMKCYSQGYGNRTEYYFDGVKVGQANVAANPKWLLFRVGGKNAKAKIYRAAKSNTAHPDSEEVRRFCETFDDVNSVAELEAKNNNDFQWEISTIKNGHTVKIEKDNSSTNYLKMRRTGPGSDASLTYTMPSDSEDATDLSIRFMYDGAGQNEFRFTNAGGSLWLGKIFTQDGKLYWGTSTSSNDYKGEVLKNWMTPFTEHTLTLRAEKGMVKIFLDDNFLAEKSPLSSGYTSGLPAKIGFYTLSKSIPANEAEEYLYSGLAIKSISIDNDTTSPAYILGTISVEKASLTTVANERPVTSLQTEPVNYTLALESVGGENKAFVLVGVYDGDTLIDVSADTVDLKNGVRTEYTAVLPGYENPEDLTLRLLVWDEQYEPVVAKGIIDEMLADDGFEVYKKYFEKNGQPENWNDEYEFSPACGKVDINLTLSQATDITVYSAVRTALFTVPASVYSSRVSAESVVTIFVDTDKDAYDVYVDGTFVAGSTFFDVTSDNIAMVKVAASDNIKNVEVVVSDKNLSNEVVNAAKPSYFYSFADGALPTDYWTYSNASYNSGGYMNLSKNNASATWKPDKVVGGTVEVSWEFNVKSTSSYSDTAQFILNDGMTSNLINLTYRNKSIRLNGTSIASSIAANQWHTIKVVYDAALCVVDVYVDGSLKKENGSGGNSWYFDDFNELILTSKTSSGMDIRNVSIKPYTYPAPSGYSDYAAAPTLASLIVPAEPTGEVYEAENMERENYAPVDFGAAHGGKAVKVTANGAGRVKTTFKGTSGYYKVNVAYMEYAELLDSSFRVYHNGKEIDFWYGKYDDGGRHVRKVSECMYVANGDIFAIEGYSNGDGSLVDYLEFVPTEEIICEKGVVIDEEYWTAVDGKVSSWDITGGENYIKSLSSAARYLQIKDQSTKEKVVAKRPFVKVAGDNIILDLVMAASFSSGSGEITIGNGNTPAIVLSMDADGMKYTNKAGSKTNMFSAVNQWTGFRLVINTEAHTFTIAKGNTTLIKNIPFANDVSILDNITVTTDEEAVATIEFLNVSLTTGYLVYEDFKAFTSGYSREWTRSASGGTSQVDSGVGGELADQAAWWLNDTSTTAAVNAKRTISLGSSTEMTVSFAMLTGDGLTATMGSGLTVSTSDGNIYANTSTPLWEGYDPTVWYKIRAEVDYSKGTADVYVNHIKKATVTLTSTTKATNIQFASSKAGTLDAYIDDVIVEDSIYVSPIPKPVPVDTGNYDIGMQACDLWRENWHFGWDSIRPYDNTRPIGGYYDEGSREQADLEIKWMVEHGISVYLPCWFRPTNPTKTPLTVGPKLDAFLSSPYIDDMEFALTWENGSSQIKSIDDFMNNNLPYWIEHYFKHPQYYMVDGNRPLIAVWNSDTLENTLLANDESTLDLFNTINAKLNEEGFGNAVFITNLQGSKTVSENRSSHGYDYTYVYSYRDKSVEQQIDNQLAQTGYGYMDAIPTLSQGWGDEPWGRGTRKANMSLAEWYGGLKYFKDVYMPARGSSSLASKLMMLDNWNEWGEGHALYPSNFAGFGYLDAVREVFGTNTSGTHTDYIPDRQNYLYVQ